MAGLPSPDLNPIENLWDPRAEDLRWGKQYKDEEALERAILQAG
jgi:transposase